MCDADVLPRELQNHLLQCRHYRQQSRAAALRKIRFTLTTLCGLCMPQ